MYLHDTGIEQAVNVQVEKAPRILLRRLIAARLRSPRVGLPVDLTLRSAVNHDASDRRSAVLRIPLAPHEPPILQLFVEFPR